jgi:predicted metal-dependent enzyme (double-stranded beta helix superfamily)
MYYDDGKAINRFLETIMSDLLKEIAEEVKERERVEKVLTEKILESGILNEEIEWSEPMSGDELMKHLGIE